ncbi:MAG: hypothetical protein N4A45_06885 [Flavobacteriales bacterium]|jgi:hypothetical protein|nr:hypothetical protein [Flavobacteriales bacterium]
MSKSTKAIVNLRVSEIASLLIDGKSRIDIVEYSSIKWTIGERQTDKYIAKARELISNENKKNVRYDYGKALKRYELLYSKAMEDKDYRLALSVNKEISQLQGLNKIEVEHSGSIEFISNIPD